MIQAGYMLKKVSRRPEWIKAPTVDDLFSVSNCVSDDFCDYINYWKHNGYWLFDSPEIIERVTSENAVDISSTRLFYYEVYEFQFDEDSREWLPFEPEPSFKTNVVPPKEKYLQGYDVVTFSEGTSPECSPLSCNSMADEIPTNKHCLLDSFETAKELIEAGNFNDSEPGPYRIFAVYTVDLPQPNAGERQGPSPLSSTR